MSFEITTSFVQQYSNTLAMLSQQMGARLANAVMLETGVTGKTYWYDQIGATAAQRINSRNSDTPVMNTPHRRRRVDLAPYNWADLIDNVDKVRMLSDPTSSYTRAGAAAMNRAKDDIIVAAAFADAYTGETGGTTTSFDSNNVVAVNSWAFGSGSGNSGMTISKLIEAKKILDSNEAGTEGEEQRFLAMSARQLSDLLATTEATSADYNTVQALVRGTLDSFMGFSIIRTQRLLTDSNSYRRCIAWVKSGICLAVGEDIVASIDKRPDKNNAWQPYYEMLLGASRVEEAKVVEIKCSEA